MSPLDDYFKRRVSAQLVIRQRQNRVAHFERKLERANEQLERARVFHQHIEINWEGDGE